MATEKQFQKKVRLCDKYGNGLKIPLPKFFLKKNLTSDAQSNETRKSGFIQTIREEREAE